MIAPRLRAWLRRLRLPPARAIRRSGVGLMVLGAGYVIGLSNQPNPASTIDVHELDGAAVRGGVLDLVATVDQRRPCLTAVQRWLWRVDPDEPGMIEWVFLPDVPFKPPAAVGIDRYRLRVPVPAWAEPGEWHYLGLADERCSPLRNWLHPSRRSPDVLVRITDPTAADPAQVVAPAGAVEVLPADATPGAPK